MTNSIRNTIVKFGMFGLLLVPVASISIVSTASAADVFIRGDGCTASFLTFPAWYEGLEREGCNVAGPQVSNDGSGLSAFIFKIVLNIIEMALQIVGYLSVGFIIYGGFKYLTSSGSADRITAGRKIILNAVIGLVISFFSVAIVNLVAGNL